MYCTDYDTLLAQLAGIVGNETDAVANLSNASAVIKMNMEGINWVGFYLVRDEQLVLGPFQGKPACIRIPFGRGVCGTAAQEDAVQLVEDVHRFKGHIACDEASNSEIVVPLHRDGKVVAVLDIDSPVLARFTAEDKVKLERCAALLENSCDWNSIL